VQMRVNAGAVNEGLMAGWPAARGGAAARSDWRWRRVQRFAT
jgi:hypothetical protein